MGVVDKLKYVFLAMVILAVYIVVMISYTISSSNYSQKKYDLYDEEFESKDEEESRPKDRVEYDDRPVFEVGPSAGPPRLMSQSELVADLRSKLIPPRKEATRYFVGERDIYDRSRGPARAVRKLTDYKTRGFFMECGSAIDYGSTSDTYFLEAQLEWSGLLVGGRCHPWHTRRAWVAPVCLSDNGSFYDAITRWEHSGHHAKPVFTPCYPFHTFMLALNRTSVDYLSLSVTGDALETIPFDTININVISVPFWTGENLVRMKDVMERKGYVIALEMPPNFVIFAKKPLVVDYLPDELFMLNK